MRRRYRKLAWMVLLAALPVVTASEQSVTFGDYTIHYSAFTTDLLQPEVAQAYQITRSKGRALLNVSVLKKLMGTTGKPVRATVKATAATLNAQLRTIDVRELNDNGAVYYIGEFPVGNEETLKFKLEVTPEGEPSPYTATFDQQFFTQ
ncbi:MAG: DUF4426 domain-containing protein [Chromatiales bacterium]